MDGAGQRIIGTSRPQLNRNRPTCRIDIVEHLVRCYILAARGGKNIEVCQHLISIDGRVENSLTRRGPIDLSEFQSHLIHARRNVQDITNRVPITIGLIEGLVGGARKGSRDCVARRSGCATGIILVRHPDIALTVGVAEPPAIDPPNGVRNGRRGHGGGPSGGTGVGRDTGRHRCHGSTQGRIPDIVVNDGAIAPSYSPYLVVEHHTSMGTPARPEFSICIRLGPINPITGIPGVVIGQRKTPDDPHQVVVDHTGLAAPDGESRGGCLLVPGNAIGGGPNIVLINPGILAPDDPHFSVISHGTCDLAGRKGAGRSLSPSNPVRGAPNIAQGSAARFPSHDPNLVVKNNASGETTGRKGRRSVGQCPGISIRRIPDVIEVTASISTADDPHLPVEDDHRMAVSAPEWCGPVNQRPIDPIG